MQKGIEEIASGAFSQHGCPHSSRGTADKQKGRQKLRSVGDALIQPNIALKEAHGTPQMKKKIQQIVFSQGAEEAPWYDGDFGDIVDQGDGSGSARVV